MVKLFNIQHIEGNEKKSDYTELKRQIEILSKEDLRLNQNHALSFSGVSICNCLHYL